MTKYYLIRDSGTVRLSATCDADARCAAANVMFAQGGGDGRLVRMAGGYPAASELVEQYGNDGETLLVSSGVRA